MRKAVFVLTIVVVSALLVASAPDSHAQPLPGQQFDKIIESAVQTGAPGIVLHVETWDGKVWSGATGVAELESRQPLTSDMRFRIYDMSKMATAALALILVDDAKMMLDDWIGKWIEPQFIRDLPHADNITVRDLIAQTSGIRDYFDERFLNMTRADPGRKWRPQELIAHAIEGDAAAAPGTEESYDSNTNFVLLGLAIEKAGGAPLATQLNDRIFEPLEMTETRSWEDVDRRSAVHGYVPQFMYRHDVSDIDLSVAWGTGGLVSTAEDIVTLTRALFEGDVLSSSSRAVITESFRPLSGSEAEYGYGTMRFASLDPAPIGHAGEGVGFGTVTAWWPQNGLIVVVLTNFEAGTHMGVLEAVARAVSP